MFDALGRLRVVSFHFAFVNVPMKSDLPVFDRSLLH